MVNGVSRGRGQAVSSRFPVMIQVAFSGTFPPDISLRPPHTIAQLMAWTRDEDLPLKLWGVGLSGQLLEAVFTLLLYVERRSSFTNRRKRHLSDVALILPDCDCRCGYSDANKFSKTAEDKQMSRELLRCECDLSLSRNLHVFVLHDLVQTKIDSIDPNCLGLTDTD